MNQYKIELLITSNLKLEEIKGEFMDTLIYMEDENMIERNLSFFRIAESVENV